MRKNKFLKICALIMLLLCADSVRCLAQSRLPVFEPNQMYCVHLKDGRKFHSSGKKLIPQSDGSLMHKNHSYSLDSIEYIESQENVLLPAFLAGTAIGVGGGVALMATVGTQKGSSGDPTGASMLAMAGGVVLVILGPLIGGLVGNSLQNDSGQVVYPAAIKSASGLVPGIGISGRY